MSMLELRGVRKRFGRATGISDIGFSVEEGVLCALLGPNGAGKTTTLNCVMGLLRHNAGSILIDGRDLASSMFDWISYVPDALSLYGWMTVREHVEMTRRQFSRFDATLVATL